MMFYIFRTRTGCDFIRWIQKKLKIKTSTFNLQPSTYNSALTVFMQWNVMMWGSYLLLMFCYDPVFLGSRHPVTLSIGVIALVASFFMMRHQMCIKAWGRSIRYALATVIVFWTFVEVMARNNFFNEVWVDPLNHVSEMVSMLLVFVIVGVVTFILSKRI